MALRPVQVGDVLGVVTWAVPASEIGWDIEAMYPNESYNALITFTDGSFVGAGWLDGDMRYYEVMHGSNYIASAQIYSLSDITWAASNYDFGGRTVSAVNNPSIGLAIQIEDAPAPDPQPNNLKAYLRRAGTDALIPVTPYFRPAGSATKHRLRAFDFRSPPLPPPLITYLTFQSESPFTLNVYDNTKHWDGTLYYSTDTITWNAWNGTTALNSVNNKLYLRGTGNTVITGSSDNYRWVLTGTAIECIGNIENLLDWETVALGGHPTMATSCYRYMFRDCTSLTTAPELPATVLDLNCYQNMFFGCTSLTTAPELPATTLADYCYYYMFSGCTSLTAAPELPATTLATYCYGYMFYNCTFLTAAPELPATTLAEHCYNSMFRDCTFLTTAPELPATVLDLSCYQSMFKDCTSLTTAPALPATTLATYCYRNMFDGCSAFKVSATQTGSYQHAWRIPTSGAGTTATSWNQDMLYGTGGTFKSAPVINTTYYVQNPPV